MGGVASALGLGGSAPDLKTVDLDPWTSNTIKQAQVRNSVPTSQIADKLNNRVGSGTEMALAAGSGNDKTLSTDDHQRSAIINEYRQQASKANANVMAANRLAAPGVQGAWLTQAYQQAMAQQQIETQNMEFLTQAHNDAARARAQAISSVMGVAGSVAGFGAAKGWFNSSGANASPGAAPPSAGWDNSKFGNMA